jgi:hypothetical protein
LSLRPLRGLTSVKFQIIENGGSDGAVESIGDIEGSFRLAAQVEMLFRATYTIRAQEVAPVLGTMRLSRVAQVGDRWGPSPNNISSLTLPDALAEYGFQGLSAILLHKLQLQNQLHQHGGSTSLY